MSTEKKGRIITREEVARHRDFDATPPDVWVVLHGKVYSVGSFLAEHPGGPEVIEERAGADATSAFEDIGHSASARAQVI